MNTLTIGTWFYDLLTKITNKIGGVESENEFLIRVGISVGIVLLIVALRNFISGGILKLAEKFTNKKQSEAISHILASLKKPLSLIVASISICIVCRIIAPSGELDNFALYVIKIGLIIGICWAAVRCLNNETVSLSHLHDEDSKTKQTVLRFVSNVSKITIICIGALLLLELFGFQASRIFTALGIGGVAVAFACKDAVENLISGFIIVFNKPFSVGDYITVDEKSGTVEDITVRATTLRAIDGSRYVLPNTMLTSQEVTNFAEMEKRLVTETFCLNYKHTTEEIKAFEQKLRSLIEKNDKVLLDDVRINFTEYAADGMNISVFFYITDTVYSDYLTTKNQLNLEIKQLIDKENIDIAYNSSTIYMEKTDK